MAGFNWDDYQEVPSTPTAPVPQTPQPAPTAAAPATFDWNAHPIVDEGKEAGNVPPPPAPADQPGALESFLRGGAQGLTGGFSDEAAGALEAIGDKLSGNSAGKSFGDLYNQEVGQQRADNAAAQSAHPYLYGTGNFVGGVGLGAATGGLGEAVGLGTMGEAAVMGAANGVGYGNAQNVTDGASDALKGAVAGGLIGGAVHGITKAFNPDALSSGAEKLAENATGATGAQLLKFEPGAGRALLDRGIVGFGDNQAQIAQKASAALKKSGQDIDSALTALDQQGAAPITRDDVLKYIQQKMAGMSGSPSQTSDLKQLQSVAEDIENGPESYTLQKAEAEKRGFQGKVNWKNPENNPANASASDAFKQAVESKAAEINPELADKFTGGKADYHLLAPIQEAAERRAAVTQQSPLGGLLDVGTAGAGLVSGHPALAVAAPIARRVLAPRIASSAAVGADKLADIIRTAPHLLGPWAGQFSAAAARGGSAVGALNFILSQTSPDYRQHMQELFNQQK